MKRTYFLAILMAFVCFGIYSCSSDFLEESRDPATRATTAGFDEFYSNLQQFVNGYADQAQLTAAEKELRDKYVFSAGFGTWYAASSSFVETDIYNALYLRWKVDTELNPSTRAVMDEATLKYLVTLLTTTYTVDHASKILPGTLIVKNIPDETGETGEAVYSSVLENINGDYVSLTASYGVVLDILKGDMGDFYYYPGYPNILFMEALIKRVETITGGTINESEAKEKMQSSYEIMTAAFGSSNPFSIDSGIAYLKTQFPQSADELSVLGLYMSKLSRLENSDFRLLFTNDFLYQLSLYSGALTQSQYIRISAAAGTAYNALEDWDQGDDETKYMIVTPTNLIIGDSNVGSVTIQTNARWQTSHWIDWLEIDRAVGEGNAVLTVRAQSNLTGADRSGTFQITYRVDDYTNVTVNVEVKQTAREIFDHYFDIDDVNHDNTNLTAGLQGGTFDIYSNTNWRVVSAPDFIYDYPLSGSGYYNFYFSTIYLPKGEVRTGELIIEYNDNGMWRTRSTPIGVTGIGLCTYYDTYGGIPTFNSQGGYDFMRIWTNSMVTVTSNDSWLRILSIQEQGDGYMVNLSADSYYNETGAQRRGSLVCRWWNSSSNSWVTVTEYIYQYGR